MADEKQILAGMLHSGNNTTTTSTASKKKKRVIITLLATVLLTAAVIGVAVGVKSRKNDSHHADIQVTSSAAHAIVKSSCSSTLYPELCFSTLASFPGLGVSKKVTDQKDVIAIALNVTVITVQHNYFAVKKLILRKDLTKREKIALHDCLETIDETLDELRKAEEDLQQYPNKKSLQQHADDLRTLLSSAITNQETCIDGFSHDEADKKVRKELTEGQFHVEKLCSNALAMIKNMTDTDIEKEMKFTGGRKLKEEEEEDHVRWPEWLSAGDRRLLQSPSVTPNVVVAADGSGNYRTVAAAVAAAPEKSSSRYVIRIKAGVYRENVEIPKKKTNIMFMGDGRSNTIITGNRNVVDGSTTFNSATVGKLTSPSLIRPIFYLFTFIYI